jgi:hypothetical protein
MSMRDQGALNVRRLLRLKVGTPGRWVRRLDRVAGEINPFLAALAIGLVMLNLCCFVSLKVVHLVAGLTAASSTEVVARH